MHQRPYHKKNCHSRECGNPQSIGGERKVQLIMFTYLITEFIAYGVVKYGQLKIRPALVNIHS